MLDGDAIRDRALHHAWRRLGDAVGVKEPYWDGEYWVVPLKVRGREGTFGQLVLSAGGEVQIDGSTSKQELLEKLDAERAGAPAA